MKSNKKLILFIAMGIIFVQLIISNNESLKETDADENSEVLKISDISGKIHVDNNWSDTKTAGVCSGDGTETDPYVIQDCIIDGNGSGSCILIENSNEHFKIENCTISNSGSDFYDATIELYWANNGNISNNQVLNPNAFGIILFGSNDNILTNNFITGKSGISIRFSNSNLIYFNNFVNSLIGLEQHNSTDNRWDSPKKMRYIFNSNTFTSYLGNYWNGFSGFDNNNDGIMDSPHIIDQHLPSSQWVYIDYYPLAFPITNYEILGIASEQGIHGYNLFFIIGFIGMISIIIVNRQKKLANK